MPERSALHPAVLPPEIFKVHGGKYRTGDRSSHRGVRTQPTSPKYSHGQGLTFPISVERLELTANVNLLLGPADDSDKPIFDRAQQIVAHPDQQ